MLLRRRRLIYFSAGQLLYLFARQTRQRNKACFFRLSSKRTALRRQRCSPAPHWRPHETCTFRVSRLRGCRPFSTLGTAITGYRTFPDRVRSARGRLQIQLTSSKDALLHFQCYVVRLAVTGMLGPVTQISGLPDNRRLLTQQPV